MENKVKFVSGALYGIYKDQECKETLYRAKDKVTGETEKVEIVTNEL